MHTIVFKNLQRSTLVEEVAEKILDHVVQRFPLLSNSKLTMTLSMDNAPSKRGLDVFTAQFHCKGGRYGGVFLAKSASNLYVAMSEVEEHLQERLNRFGDRARVRELRQARKISHFYAEGWYEKISS